MPNAKITGPDIGKLMLNIGGAIKKGSTKTLEQAALKAKRIHERQIRTATGGDMRMSGVGRSRGRPGNRKVGVRYDMKKKGELPTATIRSTGPLHLLEFNTRGRIVRSSYLTGRGRRQTGRKAKIATGAMQGPGLNSTGVIDSFGTPSRRAVLNIGMKGGGNFRRSVRHPGTKGKHPFEKGRKRSRPVVTRIMRTNTFNIVKAAAKP